MTESCAAALQVLGMVRARGCGICSMHAKGEVANRKQLLYSVKLCTLNVMCMVAIIAEIVNEMACM